MVLQRYFGRARRAWRQQKNLAVAVAVALDCAGACFMAAMAIRGAFVSEVGFAVAGAKLAVRFNLAGAFAVAALHCFILPLDPSYIIMNAISV